MYITITCAEDVSLFQQSSLIMILMCSLNQINLINFIVYHIIVYVVIRSRAFPSFYKFLR